MKRNHGTGTPRWPRRARKAGAGVGMLALAWLGLVVADLASGSALGQSLSLSIVMTDSPDPVGVGNKVTYDVTVAAPVGDTLSVTETIPPGAGYVDAESSCTRNPGSRYAVCNTLFGGTSTLKFVLIPSAPGTLTNEVSAASEVNGDSASATEMTQVVPSTNPTLSVSDVTVGEGDSGTVAATFTVSLSTAAAVTVDYATADLSAAAGADYVTKTGTLSFTAGGPVSQSVSVDVNGDALDEVDEQFILSLSSASGGVIADGEGVGTITDDDAPPSLSIDDVSVAEGDFDVTVAQFTVSLSAQSGRDVSVDVATADGTAVAGVDYQYTIVNGLYVPAGATTATVHVFVFGDTSPESDETFDVNLSNPVGATISDAQGVGTILDDDNQPPLAQDVTVTTDEDTAVTVTLAATDVNGDPLTYTIVTGPSHGTLGAVVGNQVTYTPASNYHGSDSFTFRANDGTSNSNVATVSITVSPVLDFGVNGKIAYERTNDIWVMEADGSSQTNITTSISDGVFDPAYSPDGTQIAYRRDVGGQYDIWLMNEDGTGQTALTSTSVWEIEPTWTPDGRIAFVRIDFVYQIWVMNGDGTGARRVIDMRPVSSFDPAWSPDGERIAFTSNRQRHLIEIWDVCDGTLDTANSPIAGTFGSASSPDSARVASTGRGRRTARKTCGR